MKTDIARTFAALNATNEAILYAKSHEELYEKVCEAAFSSGDFQMFGGSARIRGGAFSSTFALLGSGTVDFFGDGLVLTSLGSGSYSNPNTYYGASNFSGEYFRLTGTLQDGQTIDRTLFRAGNASGTFRLNATAVPEPGALCLIGALALPAGIFAALRTHRRKQAGGR